MRLNLVQIAFLLGHFLQFLNGLLALGGITELLVFHELHKVLISGLVDLETVGGVDALVLVVELVGVVEDEVFAIKVGCHRGVGVALHLHIGRDAVTFINRAPAHRLERLAECVGFRLRGVLFVRIVDFLNAATTGNVIMRHRDFHLRIVTQRQDILYQPFTKSPLPDDDCAVVVLQGSRHDLTGRGTVAVNKNGHRNFKVDRLVGSRMQAVGCGRLATHRNDRFPLGNEQVDNVDCLVHQAATVAAQVEDEALQLMVFPHFHEFLLHLLARVAGEAAQRNVGHAIVEHLIIRYVVDFHLFALQGLLNGFLHAVTLDFQRHFSTGLTLQQIADFLRVLLLAVDAVHLNDGITGDESAFLCRPSFVRV